MYTVKHSSRWGSSFKHVAYLLEEVVVGALQRQMRT